MNKFSFVRSMLVNEGITSSRPTECFDKITHIGRLMSDEPGMSVENLKMMIDLKHWKEIVVKGGGNKGERVREEKIEK